MRISDGSSDVCSSDLEEDGFAGPCLAGEDAEAGPELQVERVDEDDVADGKAGQHGPAFAIAGFVRSSARRRRRLGRRRRVLLHQLIRSEEHTSDLQSLMRRSYAVFCLKNKNIIRTQYTRDR